MIDMIELEEMINLMTENGESNNTKTIIELCRQGMVPADDPMIVDLRHVEWPNDSNIEGIVIRFTACLKEEFDCDLSGIAYIPRPTPAWTPKEGDKCVFWDSDDNKYPIPGTFSKDEDNRIILKETRAPWNACALIESVEEIGKPVSYFIKRGKVWRGGK